MHDQIALVTGANRGIGRAVVRQLAELGCMVFVGSREPARGELVAATLRSEGLNATALAVDVDSDASVRAAAALVADRVDRIDVLVNNAGVLPEATSTGAAWPVDVALFRQTFETNLFGAVRMIQHFSPLLDRSPAGQIVNVSSTMGSLADQTDPASPYYGLAVPAYQASKAALNVVTIAVAKLLGDSTTRITSVCPGWVQTDLGGPENRAAAPLAAEQAARTVVDVIRSARERPSGAFVDAAGPVRW